MVKYRESCPWGKRKISKTKIKCKLVIQLCAGAGGWGVRVNSGSWSASVCSYFRVVAPRWFSLCLCTGGETCISRWLHDLEERIHQYGQKLTVRPGGRWIRILSDPVVSGGVQVFEREQSTRSGLIWAVSGCRLSTSLHLLTSTTRACESLRVCQCDFPLKMSCLLLAVVRRWVLIQSAL